jgi:hypothetical protein
MGRATNPVNKRDRFVATRLRPFWRAMPLKRKGRLSGRPFQNVCLMRP